MIFLLLLPNTAHACVLCLFVHGRAGCKWTLEKLFAFLRERGHNTQRLWQRIKRLVLLTVLPLAGQVPEDPLCWELFGFGARQCGSARLAR